MCLSCIKRWEEAPEKIAALQETAIADFISQSVKSGYSLEAIIEQLQALYSKEFQISKEIFLKAQQLASEEYAKTELIPQIIPVNASESASTVVMEPLLCKDTVYHAIICSQAVSTCTAGDYQKFFKNKELVPGHAFKAISFSRSRNEESFLIAQKDESIFYFAFKGRLCLSDWAKDYKSFNEGKLHPQAILERC